MESSIASPPVSPSRTIGEALDEAPLSLFHLKAAVTSAMGFFTDAYDLFIIGVAVTLIAKEWSLSPLQTSFLSSATLIATLVGAVVFGRLADLLGRKRVYGLVAAIMALGALATSLAPSYAWLVAFRIILGLGIGGDYPVSAVLASEYANRKGRGQLVSLVFSSQAAGLLIGPVVALALLASGVNHDLVWRVMLGLGALPAMSVIYLRSRMPESPRYAAAVQGREAEARAAIEKYSHGTVKVAKSGTARVSASFRAFISRPRNLVLILGTAGSWFLLDYMYYGNTISLPVILKAVAPGDNLLQYTAWTLMIFAVFAVPGYVLAFLRIDRVGHRRLQWIGFLGMTVCFALIGLIPGLITTVTPFLVLFGVSYFFTEFGPNVTTFVIPTEVFGVAERTTGHGIAAGFGKLGAFLGVLLFPLVKTAIGLGGIMVFCAAVGVAGAALTMVLPEPSGKSLETISVEAAQTEAAQTEAAQSEALVAEPAA
ncbi:MAG TPA: MFS transporter [Candidatus Binatia bacterium]|nr:MFS transporter [Candidatus Binatia bacterium]